MMQIPLTRGMFALVDDEDYDELIQHPWFVFPAKWTFYAVREKTEGGRRKKIFMHRAILKAPLGQDVDHRDGDGLNNQRMNLRFATNSQNQANRIRLKQNISGRRGVSWNRQRKRWQALICKDRKCMFLGDFAEIDEAARAYDAAARKLFGEFARPNFAEDE